MGFMSTSAFLAAVRLYLQDAIAPIANRIDSDPVALRSALQGLGDRQWLALRVPQQWGGAEIDPPSFYQFQEQLARFSGALAFLQTQHQSAGMALVKSQNESLKQSYLPLMGSGKALMGIGFSHLRRSTKPPLKATPVLGGYRLSGQIPWLTGYRFFQDILIAGQLSDGSAVYGVVPFTTTGGIRLSPPMPLAAMNATQTVSAELKDWFLPEDCVAAIQPDGAIRENDRTNVLSHSAFALGCAQAGLDIVESVRRTKPFLAIASAQAALSDQLEDCRTAIYTAAERSFEEKLRLRVSAIELAVRCAHAAVVVSSGAANALSHPAQRVYREALVFSVAGQTTAVLEASLAQIAQKNPPASEPGGEPFTLEQR
jgi:alkylation response protein AidB-like acyl-CoA dehydrogenase